MNSSLTGRDVFIRTTLPDGRSSIAHYRVWDSDRFIAAQQAHARQQAIKDGESPSVVTLASEQEYRDAVRKSRK